jgi:hypothetical protein
MHLSRRRVRLAGAACAAIMAAVYYLIGLGVLDAGSAADASAASSMLAFGGLAGSAFLLGAILLVFLDRRWLWWLGLAFQLFVYFAYVQVSGIRNPPFEFWGISLRIIELPLTLALAYLAISSVNVGTTKTKSRVKAGA